MSAARPSEDERASGVFSWCPPHTGETTALSRCYSCPHQRWIAQRKGADRDPTEPRRASHQHHPLPVGRRRAEGELRPPRPADGRGRAGLRALDPVPAAQPGRPRLARPRPLRPLGRSRLDAALLAAAPDGLRPVARADQAVPPVGQPHARASGEPPDARASRRRPARSARASRNAVGMAIAEAHLAARFNRPGHDDRRPPHLRPGGRRRHDGRRAGRGRAPSPATSSSASSSSSTTTTASPSRARRRVSFTEDVARALRRLRLARPARGRRQRPRRGRQGAPRGAAGRATGRRSSRCARSSASARRTSRAPSTSTAPRSAPTRSRRPRRTSAGRSSRRSSFPTTSSAHFRDGGRARQEGPRTTGAGASPPTRRPSPTWPPSSTRRLAGALPAGWDARPAGVPRRPQGRWRRGRPRRASCRRWPRSLPELVGGSADLDPSTFTWLKGQGDFASPSQPQEGVQGAVGGVWGFAGRNLHFGVREHAMGAVVNGMALHGGFIPYGSTFLVFSDYMRAAVRLSALARLGSIWVYTHDSIGVGEDGPTHQPVEHFAGAARHPRPALHPSRRRERDGVGLADRDREPPPADRPGADAPERADARPLRLRLRRRPARAAPTC